MVEQVLANVARVNNHVDTMFSQLTGRTDTTEHQQLRTLKDTLGEDDLAGRIKAKLIAGGVDDSHTLATTLSVINYQTLGVNFGQNSDVGLVLYKQEAARALALVDRIDVVGEVVYFSVVDVLGDMLASRFPASNKTSESVW